MKHFTSECKKHFSAFPRFLSFLLCVTVSGSAYALPNAISLQGSVPFTTEDCVGGVLSVFHSEHTNEKSLNTIIVTLQTDNSTVWDYVQSTLESNYTLVTLCPDYVNTTLHSENQWFHIMTSHYSVINGGEIQTDEMTYITFFAFDRGGFSPSYFAGAADSGTGFRGEVVFFSEYTVSEPYEETIYTSGTVRYKYTVTADGLTPITRYLTLPTTELATTLTVYPS